MIHSVASSEEVGIDPTADLLFNEFEDCATQTLLERNLGWVLTSQDAT